MPSLNIRIPETIIGYQECQEYQRLHSENRKVQEKPDTYPSHACVLMDDSILNSVTERNLSNDQSVKVIKFPQVNFHILQHHALPVIWKQSKYFIIHPGINDTVKFTSRDSLNKLFQL